MPNCPTLAAPALTVEPSLVMMIGHVASITTFIARKATTWAPVLDLIDATK